MKIVDKIAMVLSFTFMVALNALANILPINGIGTGAVSDSYPNLFAPSGYTFAIWAVIYSLLLVLVLYLTFKPQRAFEGFKLQSRQFAWLLTLSSMANGLWILAWHYRLILISLVLMVLILVSLILLMALVNDFKWPMKQLAFVKPAIGVYLGWICVATIANVTTYLVSVAWTGFGIPEWIWLLGILGVATALAYATMGWSKCGAYGLVILWAFGGIVSKHLSPQGFDGQYPAVVAALLICMAIVLLKTLLVMKTSIQTINK